MEHGRSAVEEMPGSERAHEARLTAVHLLKREEQDSSSSRPRAWRGALPRLAL